MRSRSHHAASRKRMKRAHDSAVSSSTPRSPTRLPYRRTRETLANIYDGAGLAPPDDARGIYEDPRLREVEHGYEPAATQEELRKTHGWFYYRFKGGESPADCYDRTSSFLESMMRQVERKKADRVLIVTHGLTIRCFVMRFLHLSVEEFDVLANPPELRGRSRSATSRCSRPASVSSRHDDGA